jgi:glyoxylase-like metal-dependent hydrolase (beta-lactamase superfamily II)
VKELAPDVWQLDGFPPDLVNVYLVGDVLVDAATRHDAGRILRQLRDRPVAAHALTHAHPDHLGASHAVCAKLGIPFWVGARDAAAAEDPAELEARLYRLPWGLGPLPRNPLTSMMVSLQSGAGHPVARALREGDEVAGFRVLETPGHTAGHIALWRAEDRVLIAGDVLWNFRLLGGLPGLTEPPPFVSPDPGLNRDSARRLASLEPALVCFGHGPPMRDTEEFVEFVERLEA